MIDKVHRPKTESGFVQYRYGPRLPWSYYAENVRNATEKLRTLRRRALFSGMGWSVGERESNAAGYLEAKRDLEFLLKQPQDTLKTTDCTVS